MTHDSRPTPFARRLRACTRLLGLVAIASACSVSATRTSASRESVLRIPGVRMWLTTPDRAQLLARAPDVAPTDTAAPGATTVTVDATQRFQRMVGFGAAVTDASAWLIQTRLSTAQRDTLLRELFGRDGLGIGFARFTLGASDFSRTHVTYNDRPAGERDETLRHFSIASAGDALIPVLRQARAINPSLTLMATPWSAPAWMKTSGSLVTGTLRPADFPHYAEYLRRTVAAFDSAGVPIAMLSVQNEPHFEPKDYPGMRLMPEQRAELVGRHVGPLFAARGMRTQLIEWDHNWDAPESPLTVLADPQARRYISGVAWHCYAGDVAAQSRVHDAFPTVDTWFTECAGGAWAPNWADNLRWNVKTLMIGATRNWARGVTLWNLALDEQHGPHLGGCNDCRGVLTIDSRSGAVTRNEEYYAIAHLSRFVRRDAVRIASTTGVDDLDTVAFRNADDGSTVLVVVNSAPTTRTMAVRAGGTAFHARIPAGAVGTLVWY